MKGLSTSYKLIQEVMITPHTMVIRRGWRSYGFRVKKVRRMSGQKRGLEHWKEYQEDDEVENRKFVVLHFINTLWVSYLYASMSSFDFVIMTPVVDSVWIKFLPSLSLGGTECCLPWHTVFHDIQRYRDVWLCDHPPSFFSSLPCNWEKRRYQKSGSIRGTVQKWNHSSNLTMFTTRLSSFLIRKRKEKKELWRPLGCPRQNLSTLKDSTCISH
jgi:hypothetical protein